eukprot:TRINITY_DN24172_c0_g1_i1.p1 TRINITY_DN24172_c0_g1~~TRINITY_DN24172_c0_g1_i1.p1  ORF type:complete len:431 (+),score=109.96 TRINITY_DN24172_c0_g1_i1:94-1293(+)
MELARSTIDLFHEEAMKAKERGGGWSEGSSQEEAELSGFDRVLEGMKALLGQLERCGDRDIEKKALKLHWRPLESKVHELLYGEADAESVTSYGSRSTASFATNNNTLRQHMVPAKCLCGIPLSDDYIHHYREASLHEFTMKRLEPFLYAHNIPVSRCKQENLEKIINTIREEELSFAGCGAVEESDLESSLCPIEEDGFSLDDDDEGLKYAEADMISETDDDHRYTPTDMTLTPAVGWHASCDDASPLPKIPMLDDSEGEEDECHSPKLMGEKNKSVTIGKVSAAVKRVSEPASSPSRSSASAGRSTTGMTRHNTLPPKSTEKAEKQPALAKRRASEPSVKTSKIGDRLSAMATQATANKIPKKQEPKRKKSISQPSSVITLNDGALPNFMKPKKSVK